MNNASIMNGVELKKDRQPQYMPSQTQMKVKPEVMSGLNGEDSHSNLSLFHCSYCKNSKKVFKLRMHLNYHIQRYHQKNNGYESDEPEMPILTPIYSSPTTISTNEQTNKMSTRGHRRRVKQCSCCEEDTHTESKKLRCSSSTPKISSYRQRPSANAYFLNTTDSQDDSPVKMLHAYSLSDKTKGFGVPNSGSPSIKSEVNRSSNKAGTSLTASRPRPIMASQSNLKVQPQNKSMPIYVKVQTGPPPLEYKQLNTVSNLKLSSNTRRSSIEIPLLKPVRTKLQIPTLHQQVPMPRTSSSNIRLGRNLEMSGLNDMPELKPVRNLQAPSQHNGYYQQVIIPKSTNHRDEILKQNSTVSTGRTLHMSEVDNDYQSFQQMSSSFMQGQECMPLQCPHCPRQFSQRSSMRAHLELHSGTHTCEICSRTCPSKSALQIHMRRHTNEKPYTCQFCSRTFSQKCNLTTHEWQKHTSLL